MSLGVLGGNQAGTSCPYSVLALGRQRVSCLESEATPRESGSVEKEPPALALSNNATLLVILLALGRVLGLGAVLPHPHFWGPELGGLFASALGHPPSCFAAIWSLALCRVSPGYPVTVPAVPGQHWSFPDGFWDTREKSSPTAQLLVRGEYLCLHFSLPFPHLLKTADGGTPLLEVLLSIYVSLQCFQLCPAG